MGAVVPRIEVDVGTYVAAERFNGKIIYGQILKSNRKMLELARYEHKDGSWHAAEIIAIQRQAVKHSVASAGGGELDNLADRVLRQCNAEDEAVAGSVAGVEVADGHGAEEEGQPHAEGPLRFDGSGGGVGDGDELHYYNDAEDGEVNAALMASSPASGMMPENRAKNQVAATPEEVAGGSHVGADLKELQSFYDLAALGSIVKHVTKDIARKTMTAGWRRTWKGTGNERSAKSRLFVRGYEDKRDQGWLETYSGTMNFALMLIALVYALVKGWRAAKVDVKTAFLQTESVSELYMRLPKDLPPGAAALGFVPGGVYPQKKAVYGRTDSPRLFTDSFKQAASAEGWVEADESILVRRNDGGEVNGLLFMHVDDLFCAAEQPEAELKQLQTEFKMGPIEELTKDVVKPYIGIDIEWDGTGGVCRLGQEKYANEITTGLTEKEKRKKFGVGDLALGADGGIEGLQKQQQAWVGVLGWLVRTQPHLSVVFGEVSRNNTRASNSTVLAARRACEYAKATHRPLCLFRVVRPAFVLWADASYDVTTCDGRLGWELQLVSECDVDGGKGIARLRVGNVVAWRSKRCTRKLASTTSAELVALLEGIKAMPRFLRFTRALWGVVPRLLVGTDSESLLGWLRTRRAKTDSAMQGVLELVIERLECAGALVLWVPSEQQRADRHTKFIGVS